MTQPTILHTGDGKTDRIQYKVVGSTVIEAGDLVYASSNYVYAVASATNDSRFAGVAYESSSSTESSDITVLEKCIIDVDVATGTFTINNGLTYSADNKLDDDSGSNTMAWAHESGSSVSRLKVKINIDALQKTKEVNS